MDKTFTDGSQTIKFMKFSRYTVTVYHSKRMHVSLTKWCDCSTNYEGTKLAIALVIAESHYASGVIVALFLEGVIIIMELNMAVASLYYP